MRHEPVVMWHALPDASSSLDVRSTTLGAPLTYRRPRVIVVGARVDEVDHDSGLFHSSFLPEYIAAVFGVMAMCSHHVFLVSTSFTEKMKAWFKWLETSKAAHHSHGPVGAVKWYGATAELFAFQARVPHAQWPLPNVWLGATVSNQNTADNRVPFLLDCPAAARFIVVDSPTGSIDLDLPRCDTHDRDHVEDAFCTECADDGFAGEMSHGHWLSLDRKIGLVIVNANQHRGAKPIHPKWVRELEKTCTTEGLRFVFTGWGWWAIEGSIRAKTYIHEDGRVEEVQKGEIKVIGGDEVPVYRNGTRDRAGELDGKFYRMPDHEWFGATVRGFE